MATFEADPQLLDSLIVTLKELRSHSNEKPVDPMRTRNTKKSTEESPTNINKVLEALLKEVSSQLEIMQKFREEQEKFREEQEKKVLDISNQLQEQKDQLDEVQQRGLKGNIIISSPTSDGKTSLLKTESDLEKDGISVIDHALSLIKSKYDVVIPVSDVQACHHLPNKSILLRVWNRRPGSAWASLTQAIKTGGNRQLNVFGNFHLTKRRNSILHHLRSLKKIGKINKFFSNENGQLSFRASENSKKLFVTYFSSSKDSTPKTLSIEEINLLLDKK
jgi:hypothetical protein